MNVIVRYAQPSGEKTGWEHTNARSITVRKGILYVNTDSGRFHYPVANLAYWKVER